MALVKLPRFMPDRSRFDPNASSAIQNCRPTASGWGPLKSLVSVSAALPTAPRGAVAVKSDSGVWKLFAGTATNLYRIESTDYTLTEISRATDDYSLSDGIAWRFARFGNFLIATAPGSTFPQFVDLGTTDDFANLTNATFEAALVWTAGDFLVFGQIDGDKRKLKWSGVNDMEFWTKAQRGSDEQVLPDGGDIQAGLSQANHALIVQETTIRQMMFDPESGLTFRFVVIDPERGALAPRSVVNIGPNDFVYLAKDGFYRGIEAKPIGAERVDRWFFDTCASDEYDLVSGVADPFDKIVWWRFADEAGTNFLLGYDWQLNEWFYSTNNATELFAAATTGYTLSELDAFGNLGTLPYPFGSRFWQGGIPGFAGFTSDFKFGFFDGANLEALIETEDKALNYPRRAKTGQIRVLVDADDSEVAIASKETQKGTLNFGSYLTQESGKPYISSRVSGRWHRFRAKLPAGSSWTNAVGIDVEYGDAGAR
ncbi:MAG: hypothetical protein Q8P61_03590 [Candidatus Nanopelagicales bacterium]|nr:hypothetical protein [Candidatus Nanopelagicales bacterium]